MRKIFICTLLLSALLLSSAPAANAASYSYITDAASLSGSDYTDIPSLASALDDIFSGGAALFSDITCKNPVSAPVGSRTVPVGTTYYVRESGSGSVFSGSSCYIYANAVYSKLFGDVPYHGSSASWQNSICIASSLSSASYSLFSKYGVRTGALLRTTSNADGSYNGSSGHSIIILDFDSEGISYLEGNGDGKGLIRVVWRTWDSFNSNLLSSRGYVISFIVQPTEKHYSSLSGENVGTGESANTGGNGTSGGNVGTGESANTGGNGTSGGNVGTGESANTGGNGTSGGNSGSGGNTSGSNYTGFFSPVKSYDGRFSDVSGRDWFYSSVSSAFSLGLMDGRTANTFAPYESVTVSEAVTLAARLLSRYWDDGHVFTSSAVWYEPYYEYCSLWGIDASIYGNPQDKMTRGAFAHLAANIMPDDALKQAVSVSNGSLADVSQTAYYCGSVYTLYRAGILTGSAGLINPENSLSRAEAAAIVSRIADKSLRSG
ncbi:MAG: S-layer homology domain-containing protein [Oscillospiraceae bacterium]